MLFFAAMDAIEDGVTQSEPPAMEVTASIDSIPASTEPVSTIADPLSAPVDPVSITQPEPLAMEGAASTDSVSAPTEPDPTLTNPVSCPADPVSASIDPVSAPIDPISSLADVPDLAEPSSVQSEPVGGADTVDPDLVQEYPGPPKTNLDPLEKEAAPSEPCLPSGEGEAVTNNESSSRAPEASPDQSTMTCTGKLLPQEDTAAGQRLTVTAMHCS